MLMNIPQRIDAIIQRRKQWLPEIEAAVQRLELAQTLIDRFDSFRTQLNDGESEFMVRLSEQLATVSTTDFHRECERSLIELKRFYARFSRDEVNISFVGRARQGKSLVLQRISGLKGDVIPSSDGSHCTGTRSIISNAPDSETVAEIDFYTEREYADIVNTYLETIFHGTVDTVSSARDIQRLDLGQLHEQVNFESNELYELLKKYVDHVGDFIDKFGAHMTVPKDQIESYVAQYSSKDHHCQYYTYLCVKQANIHAPFPCAQCGRIVLMDTIGAGDTALGIEEDMIATVQNSDAIVLVLCPDAKADIIYKEEFDLVNLIARAVTPEYAEQMLFWLMNRRETADYNNARRIPVVIEKMKNLNAPVAKYLNVDCWQTEDVEANLLIPVLEQMSQHLDEIDQMIFDRVNKMLSDTEQAYQVISKSIERAEVASISDNLRREFRPKIQERYDLILSTMRSLFLEYSKKANQDCALLKQEAEVKLKNILRSLPSKEEIEDVLRKKGGMTPGECLNYFTDKLRLQIINDFLGLNVPLHQLVRDMKREALHCWADEDTGGLAVVVDADQENPVAWFNTLKQILDEKGLTMLSDAVEPFVDFNLRMENFLIYKVRFALGIMDWMVNPQKQPTLYGNLLDLDALAAEIQDCLHNILETVYRDVRKELSGYYNFPNTAMFAVLRDLHDRIARTVGVAGANVTYEWEDLYEGFVQKLWREQFNAIHAVKARSDEWSSLRESVRACAVPGYFQVNRKEAS